MLLVILGIIFVLGWPLEWVPIVLIVVPILLPLVTKLGIDLSGSARWSPCCLQTAWLSPPVALSAYFLKGVVPRLAARGHLLRHDAVHGAAGDRPRCSCSSSRSSRSGCRACWATDPGRELRRHRPKVPAASTDPSRSVSAHAPNYFIRRPFVVKRCVLPEPRMGRDVPAALLWLVGRHELIAAADQIGAAHLLQRLAQHRPVVGIVIAQEGLVQAARAQRPTPRPSRSPRANARSGLMPVWYMPSRSPSASG